MDSSDELIGPALPPHLAAKNKSESQKERLTTERATENTESATTMEHLRCRKERAIGPSLPPNYIQHPFILETGQHHIKEPKRIVSYEKDDCHDNCLGDGVDDDDDDDDDFGPMPISAEAMDRLETEAIRSNFEQRSEDAREKILNKGKQKPVTRESWMTELPELHRKEFGLTNRTFRKTSGIESDDASSWISTPHSTNKAEIMNTGEGKQPLKTKQQIETEIEIQKTVEKFNAAKRNESLLALHERKLKKAKKEMNPDAMAGGRLRFDRERDLLGGYVSPSAKRNMIRKAAGFQSKFTTGSQ
eukprot:gene6097-7380_t